MVWFKAGICILRETDKGTVIYVSENKIVEL